MLNQYETVFILNPVLSDVQVKESVEKYESFIKANGGEIIHSNYWGLRKMAYPIQKKSSGFYHLVEFKAPGELIQTLEVSYKRDERVLRFLTVKLDKFAAQYSEKRRNKNKETEKA